MRQCISAWYVTSMSDTEAWSSLVKDVSCSCVERSDCDCTTRPHASTPVYTHSIFTSLLPARILRAGIVFGGVCL